MVGDGTEARATGTPTIAAPGTEEEAVDLVTGATDGTGRGVDLVPS